MIAYEAHIKKTKTIMNPIRIFNNRKTKLRLFGPGEPGNFEQLAWLVRMIRELKTTVRQLKHENDALKFQVKGNQPITDAEMEVLVLREQLNDLWISKAKLEHNVDRISTERKALRTELYETTWRHEKAA